MRDSGYVERETDEEIEEYNVYRNSYQEIMKHKKEYNPENYKFVKEELEPICLIEKAEIFPNDGYIMFNYIDEGAGYTSANNQSLAIRIKFKEYDTQIGLRAFWSSDKEQWFPDNLPMLHLSETCHICNKIYDTYPPSEEIKSYRKKVHGNEDRSCRLGISNAKYLLEQIQTMYKEEFTRFTEIAKETDMQNRLDTEEDIADDNYLY